MTATRLPLTAIVLTLNEADNIERCLHAMRRVDDVAIVDSGSDDGTLEAARRARPDVRVFAHPFRDFGDQRNWALDHAEPRHDWVLFVDADEVCTPELLDEIGSFIAAPGPFVGGYVAGRTEFLGRWLKRCTLHPSFQLRLLRLGEVRFRKEGHGQKEVTAGPLRYLRQGWVHHGFSKGLHQWIARHNDYSTNETGLIRTLRNEAIGWRDLWGDPVRRRRCLKRLGARAPLRPWVRFLYVYLWKRGFLDGRAGLVFCLLRLAHDIHIMAKLAEEDQREEAAGIGTPVRLGERS